MIEVVHDKTIYVLREENSVRFYYTNHRNESAWRHAIPVPVPPVQDKDYHNGRWSLVMYDLDKKAVRTFCLYHITNWYETQYHSDYPTTSFIVADPRSKLLPPATPYEQMID